MVYNASPDLSGLVKTWLVLPLAILASVILEYCFKRWGSKKVFYGVLASFFVYMLAYVYVIGPYSHKVTIVERGFAFICKLLDTVSSFLTFKSLYLGSILDSIFGSIMRNFSVAIYYVVSELYGNIFIGMLFWGLVNSTTKVEDASKTFTIYTGISAVASILAGWSSFSEVYPAIKTGAVGGVVKKVTSSAAASKEVWDMSLKSGFNKLAVVFVIIGLTYYLSRRNAEQDPNISFSEEKAFLKKKKKGKLTDGINYLFSNKYIRAITISIVCYSALMFYFEYLYKGISMELLGGDKLKFKAVQALGMLCLGVSGLLTTVVLLLSRNMSWGRIMLVTPSSMLITGGLFYLSACGFLPVSLTKALGLGKVMSNGFWNIEIANTIFEGAPIEHSVAVIVLGAIQGFISKTSKYMFFDVAKERAFLLATYEERTVGKNAMESVVARFGKAAAASSLTTIMVPLLRYATSDTSTQSARLVLPYMGVIIAGLFAMFFYQVLNLIRIYNRRLSIYKKNNQVVPENIIELQDIEEVPEASQPQAKEAPEADEVVTDHMSSIHYADEEDEEADILGPFEEGEALSSDEDAEEVEEVDLEEQAEV
jgi:AAA family ATP:ADP antiporter